MTSSPALVSGIGFLILALLLCCWSLLGSRVPGSHEIQRNLRRGLTRSSVRTPTRGRAFEALASRFTPQRFVARLDRQLSLAGRPPAWPLRRLVGAKLVLAAVGVSVGLLLVSSAPSARTVSLACGVAVLAYFVPDLLVYSRGTERQAAIALELPDTLDQMTIAVEAGLGFDAAMSRTGQNGKGPLAAELVRTLQDMQLGMSRREAYSALAARTSAPDLRRFVNAILQADKYGISISAVLRSQAGEMRVRRRQRAEEKAMQIPVKVLFPLMVCIMPVLFIVLLGPAAISVITTFSG
jgi:tight adherence protein C